jgi:hypothetical protein
MSAKKTKDDANNYMVSLLFAQERKVTSTHSANFTK